jgi:hypothetical protein
VLSRTNFVITFQGCYKRVFSCLAEMESIKEMKIGQKAELYIHEMTILPA